MTIHHESEHEREHDRALELARAAARSYCEEHQLGDAAGLDDPPLLGPVTIERDGRSVVAFRWLGAGRGEDYVQAEVHLDSGQVTVSGAKGHDTLPTWTQRDSDADS